MAFFFYSKQFTENNTFSFLIYINRNTFKIIEIYFLKLYNINWFKLNSTFNSDLIVSLKCYKTFKIMEKVLEMKALFQPTYWCG